MSASYGLRKTRAKALLEKALLDSVVENPIPCGSGKTDLLNALNPYHRKQNKRLFRKSSGVSLKQKETINSQYLSLTTATFDKQQVELIAANEEIQRSTLSCSSQLPINEILNEYLRRCHRLIAPKSGELKLDHKLSVSSDEVFEKPANNGQGDENSDYDSFPQISESDTELSDWRDQFSLPESDSEFNVAKISSKSTDSCSYSFDTWSSRSTSRMPKPMCKRTLKPKDLLPAGMVFVGWLNTKTGKRFKTFQLNAKLRTVIDWLGSPLPIVIQEQGRAGRRCDSDLTLEQALGKMLKSPSQQGIAFFTGLVNGKLSYLMTMVDLDELCAHKAREDKELEKVKSWV